MERESKPTNKTIPLRKGLLYFVLKLVSSTELSPEAAYKILTGEQFPKPKMQELLEVPDERV